jgi:hypothetical protein
MNAVPPSTRHSCQSPSEANVYHVTTVATTVGRTQADICRAGLSVRVLPVPEVL